MPASTRAAVPRTVHAVYTEAQQGRGPDATGPQCRTTRRLDSPVRADRRVGQSHGLARRIRRLRRRRRRLRRGPGLDFHEDKPPGVLLSRVESDAETLNQLFSTVAVELLRNGMLFVGILAVMFAKDLAITAWILLLLPVMFGVTALFFARMKPI